MRTDRSNIKSIRKCAFWGFSLVLAVFLWLGLIAVPANAQEQQPILIGVLFDGSGRAAFYSGQTVMGIEAAADEINKSGGIMGKQIKLAKQDDGNNPNVAPMRTRALIEGGAVAVIMTSGSASTLQARVVLEEMQVPGLTANLNPKIVEPPNNTYIFSIGNDSNQIVEALTEAVKPYKRLAIFTDNSPTGMGLADSYKSAFEKAGIKVLMVEAVDVGATDATAIVSRMKANNVDAVFVSGQAAGEQALFLRTAEMQGLDVPMFQDITAGSPKYHQLAGAAALKNLRFITSYDPDNQYSKKIEEIIKAKFGGKAVEPTLYLQGWDDVYLLKTAIENAGSTKGIALRDAIEKISGFRSSWGQEEYTLNCSKDNHLCSSLKGIVLRGFENGKPGKVVQRF
jgi:branched-chain amino acid transport system substrate-binding protein